jgi:CBS domain-containing protein
MFAVELTHNGGLMIPVLLACVTAYAISVLLQRRSLVTEGLSRKGLHLSREYGVDPLETVMVREVMHTSVFALPSDATRQDAADWLDKMNHRGAEAWSHWQRIFPLIDEHGSMKAILTRSQMITSANAGAPATPLIKNGITNPKAIGPWDTLRTAAEKMAELKLRSFPVIDENGLLAGNLNIEDLLEARSKATLRDRERRRVLRLRWPFGQPHHADPGVNELVDKALASADRQERMAEETVMSQFDKED